MKRTILTLLFVAMTAVCMANNQESVTYGKNKSFKINSKYVVQLGKEFIYTVDTLRLRKVDGFYSSRNTPKKGVLYADKKVLFSSDGKDSTDLFYDKHKYNDIIICNKDVVIRSIDETKTPKDTLETVAIIRPFKDSDIDALLRIIGFICDIDTACINDTINLSINNDSWKFEGEFILGSVSHCVKNDSQPAKVEKLILDAKVGAGDKPLVIKGKFKHQNFEFPIEKEFKKIYINSVAGNTKADNSNIMFWIITGIIIIIAVIIVTVIIIRKRSSKAVEAENGDSKPDNIKLQDQINSLKRKNSELENSNLEKDRKIEKIYNEKVAAEIKANTIAQERDKLHQKKYDELNSKKQELEKEFNEITDKYREKIHENENLNSNLARARAEIEVLNNEMQIYREKVTFVPFANRYCEIIKRLFSVTNKVSKGAAYLQQLSTVDDPWHIIKAIARYNTAMMDVEVEMLYTEINMVYTGQLVLNGTMLSQLKTECNQSELENSIKSYFFNSYLSKYIDALIVFNESLAGIHRLTQGVTDENTKQFAEFRTQINAILDELGITVKSVHLFENVGQKIDLQAEVGDFGDFTPGTILEIENCIVYLTGGNEPETKIKVKIQE